MSLCEAADQPYSSFLLRIEEEQPSQWVEAVSTVDCCFKLWRRRASLSLQEVLKGKDPI